MRPLAPLALLTVLALASGCLGGDDAAPAAVAPTTPTPASASPGAAPSTPDAQAASNATAEASLPEAVPVAVSFDGTLDNHVGVCEFEHVGDCIDTPTGTGSSAWLQETPGAATAIAVEMTWEAATPMTETLGLMAVACWEPEEGGMACTHLDGIKGASPLVLDMTGLKLADNAILRLVAYLPTMLPESPVPGAFAWYEFEQPFHIEGVVLVQPAA